MTQLLLALVGSYLVGSIPTGYLLVKWVKRVDVRTLGSGNVGATNVTRVAGGGLGKLVFVLDAAKGLVAVLLIAPLAGMTTGRTLGLSCGIMAVLGHNFPIFLRFQGGKGVATTIGVVLSTMPEIAAVCLGVWLICFAVWRYVSVASLAAAAALPLAQLAARHTLAEVLLGGALAVLIAVRHRTNIQRLLAGAEHRAGRTHHSG